MNSSMPAAVHSWSDPGTTCLTIISMMGRGVGWSTPSWVGTRRRYGAQGRGLSQAIEGASRTSRPTRARLDRRQSTGRGFNLADPQAPVGLGQRGRGQETHAEVQVAPDPQAAVAEGVHPPPDVPGDLAPGLLVGAQHRIRSAAGRL